MNKALVAVARDGTKMVVSWYGEAFGRLIDDIGPLELIPDGCPSAKGLWLWHGTIRHSEGMEVFQFVGRWSRPPNGKAVVWARGDEPFARRPDPETTPTDMDWKQQTEMAGTELEAIEDAFSGSAG